MRPFHLPSALCSLTVLSLLFGRVLAQSLTLKPPQPVPGGLRVELQGPPDSVQRIDRSEGLSFWSPVEVLGSPATTKAIVDPGTNAPARFFRAVGIEKRLEVLRVTPLSGVPGDEVVLEGQFFVPGKPGDHVVTIGGATSVVSSATSTRLTLRVPPDAQSGLLLVSTPTESAAAPSSFTVLKRVPVRVDPPSGGTAGRYVVVNTHGGAVGAGLPVPLGRPLISMAVPTNDAKGTLLAVTVGPPSLLVFDATTTAEAMVFLHPLFQTIHPQTAQKAMAAIHATPQVAVLGQLMHGHFASGRNPVDQPDFAGAYSNALVAVSGSPGMRQLVQDQAVATSPGVPGRAGRRSAGPVAEAADFPVDSDWIEVSRYKVLAGSFISEIVKRWQGQITGEPLKPRERLVVRGQSETYPYATTVDWFVRVDEIDVDAAFPGGRPDFSQAWQQPDSRAVYPVRVNPGDATPGEDPFPRYTAVGAKTFNEVTVPVKTLAAFVTGAVQDALKPPADEVKFPDRAAIYRVTAVGPSFALGPELDRAIASYSGELARAHVLNLLSGTCDAVSVFIDIRGLVGREVAHDLLKKIGLEAAKKVPSFRSSDDLLPAFLDLVKFTLGELADGGKDALLEHGLGEALEGGVKVVADNYVKAAVPALKALDVGGGIGQIVLRVRGTAVITPLETTFVVIGDPFRLELLDVTPAVGRAGDEVVVRFRGPPGMGRFGAGGSRDAVEFLGPDFFEGEVVSVTGPGADRVQALKVRIPERLPLSSDGTYELTIGAGGRVGKGTFRVASQMAVYAILPNRAFAPSASFLGSVFAGDQVRLTGLNFNRKDRFICRTATGEAVATGVADNRPDGDVSFTLPAGVITGPIRVEHALAGGGVQTNFSPVLTILGAPVVRSVTPGAGPVGTTVSLELQNIGTQAIQIAATIGGRPLQSPVLLGERLVGLVPSGAAGSELVVETPGGKTTNRFVVTQGLANGGTIQVGGDSPISIEVAAGIANGVLTLDEAARAVGYPVFDDADGAGDPPREPGDFVTDNLGLLDVPRFPVGSAFRDFISIASPLGGMHTIRMDRDALTGVVTGTLLIEGQGGQLNLTVEGTVVVKGDGFALNRPKGHGTLILEGNNNVVASAELTDGAGPGLIIRGDGNRVTTANLSYRTGDGLRVEGGRFNQIEVSLSVGNQGHGIVVTDEAADNDIKFFTGRIGSGGFVIPGSGNQGHGLLLTGSARNNRFSHYNGGSSGNLGDGIRLDGPGVVGNSFFGHLCTGNAGNGITITNGAGNNSFGTRTATGRCVSNVLSGFAIYGASGTEVSSINTANGEYGLLVSGVDDRLAGRLMMVASGLFTTDGTNGRAGLRLEDGCKGVRVDTSIGDLRRNRVGVEIAGRETKFNSVNLVVRDCVRQGAVVTDASDNDLSLKIGDVADNGVELRGAEDNAIRVVEALNCGGAALVLVGASGNHIVGGRAEPFASTVSGVVNGIVVSGGSERNVLERLTVSSSTGSGIVMRDPGTTLNQVIRCTVNGSAADGIQILAGASLNRLGDEAAVGLNPYRVAIQNNAGAGVRVSGVGTEGNEIQLCNFARQARQGTAIVIENGASGTLVRSNQFLSTPGAGSGLTDIAVLVRDGATRSRITQQRFSQIGTCAVLVSNATHVLVGGPAPSDANVFDTEALGVVLAGAGTTGCVVANNQFEGHGTAAVRLSDAAHDNVVGPRNSFRQGAVGVLGMGAARNEISGNRFEQASTAAVDWQAGSSNNRVFQNTLSGNAVGVRIQGVLASGNAILDNSSTGNTGKGILLLDGANAGIRPPDSVEIVGESLLGSSDAPDGSIVELFLDSSDEGFRKMGEVLVIRGRFEATIPRGVLRSPTFVNLNATVTDPRGNTSEFSPPL